MGCLNLDWEKYSNRLLHQNSITMIVVVDFKAENVESLAQEFIASNISVTLAMSALLQRSNLPQEAAEGQSLEAKI